MESQKIAKLKRIKNTILSCLLCSAIVVNISGCSFHGESSGSGDDLSTTGFAFNTTYTITFYDGGSQELLDSCVSKCTEYEDIFSRTKSGSELYNINEVETVYLKVVDTDEKVSKMWNTDSVIYSRKQIQSITQDIDDELSEDNDVEYTIKKNGSICFEISDTMNDILKKGLYYSKLSDGAFDITILPVSSQWDFTSDNPQVPDDDDISQALKYIDYNKIAVNDDTLMFNMPGMGIDLGGIAKGFIADGLKEYLVAGGVKSGMINLGGNILCIGRKSDDEDFHIGIQQPFADRNETIAAVNADDVSIVSSGIYERYFETSDGTLYHHILNPKTGYSYDNGLIAVTIISDKSVDGDGLSTTCFALGLEDGMDLINSIDGACAVFITDDEQLHYSEEFKDMLYEE